MRHITLVVAVLAVTPVTNICAQDSPPITVNDRVRVTAPTLDVDKYDGAVRAIDGDTLIVDSLRVALTSVTRLDVHRGRKSNWMKGALIGGVPSGLILGGLTRPTAAKWERRYRIASVALPLLL